VLQAFFARNAWPKGHPELREAMERVYMDCTRLSAALLRVFAVALLQDRASSSAR
jgi:isopenicillin N synthase-like dioxygenase